MLKASAGSVAERDVARARLELATREAEVEALAVTEAELKAKLRQLEEIRADFAARIAEAETEVARKQLALDRTRILSPIDGRVLRLLAVPGQKKMLRMDDPDSSTLAILYDPQKLQARIDVPLAEAARLAEGQFVRLRSELLPDEVFRGRVTRIVGEADLQRNTLQAKVAIENPDDRLRPDMLCRAEFLDPPVTVASDSDKSVTSAAAPTSDSSRVRVFAPLAALSGNESEASVWKVDRFGGRVVPQLITLGPTTRENHRLVLAGLKPGDRVVLDPPADLEPGDRFRPIESSSPESPLPSEQ
jgi:multidrug efflux pump subunit AcrA (membrane-fusion protein)